MSRSRSWLLGAVAATVLGLCAPRIGRTQDPRRGDLDGDGALQLTDAVNLLEFLFRGTFQLRCRPIADANADAEVDISDAVAVLGVLFLGHPSLLALRPDEIAACPGNRPPVIPSLPPFQAYAGYTFEALLPAEDPDGDGLAFEPIALPAGASLEASGRLRWAPAADQLGAFPCRFAVVDSAMPPNRSEGERLFLLQPLDGCTRPRCDPTLGCFPELAPLSEACCGEPAPRLADPGLGCPDGRALHVGRNPKTAVTIGRLVNCDQVRLVPLGQGGHMLTFNLQASCIPPEAVLVRARLETASVALFDEQFVRDFTPVEGGLVERRGIGLIAEGQFTEGQEALLSVWIESIDGVTLERKLRLAITLERLEDLP